MRISDPARPITASGLPAWANAPDLALPRIAISYVPSHGWRAEIMVGNLTAFSWKEYRFGGVDPLASLPALFNDWETDPEETCRIWFLTEPPTSHQANPPTTVMLDFDPDLIGA